MARHREFDEEEALASALGVFWQRGYTAAGMQELCAAMGLNPGSVYAAYGNKHDLFIAAMQRYLVNATRDGIGLIEANPSAIEGIRDYFNYLIDGIVDGRRRWGCFGTNAFMEMGERDDQIRKIMTEHFQKLEDAFLNALTRGNGTSDCDLANHARYLVCMAQGLNVIAKTAPDRQKLNGIVDAALSPFLATAAAGASAKDRRFKASLVS